MSDYRRCFVPGGTYFFTVVTHLRRPILTDDLGRRCLREAIDTVRVKYDFAINAFVLLPEHLHCLWTLPTGDARYPLRWRRIKEEFTERFLESGGKEGPISASRRRRQERGVWQRRYWEHTVRDEHDFERHFDYIHWNPAKHKLVQCPNQWPFSSFERWQKLGIYDSNWGCQSAEELDFTDLDETAMEME